MIQLKQQQKFDFFKKAPSTSKRWSFFSYCYVTMWIIFEISILLIFLNHQKPISNEVIAEPAKVSAHSLDNERVVLKASDPLQVPKALNTPVDVQKVVTKALEENPHLKVNEQYIRIYAQALTQNVAQIQTVQK